ncbi:hypothetical protein QNM97_18575 [Gordonia sp. L191]|uniref:hypothetical protein n=1 Tax=Gordonia sp. L191 TaxID=2982699 RepID=UPI0024BF51B5|nr:hypothetical protein [Gordonia sp. L191]WHU45995.1 hypothetical protein QNM97_18575 [Gordonia sp. L191]
MSASIDPGHGTGPQPDSPEGAKPKLVESIVIASELWLVVIVAHVVTVIATFGTTRDMYHQVAKQSYTPGSAEYDMITSGGVIVGLVVVTTIVEIGVAVALLILTRKGYNWARFILGAISLYLVISTFFSLFGDVAPRWAMIPNVIGGVAALGAVVLLLRRESDTYCKKMAQYRRAPRMVGTPYPPVPGFGPYPPTPGYPPQPGYPQQGYPPTQGYPPSQGYPPPGYPTPGPYPPSTGYPPNPSTPNPSPPDSAQRDVDTPDNTSDNHRNTDSHPDDTVSLDKGQRHRDET